MRLAVAFVALAAFVAVGVAAQPPVPSPPVFPDASFIQGLVRLPYAGIVEPFSAWLNNDKMRVEYYGSGGFGTGMDTYVFRSVRETDTSEGRHPPTPPRTKMLTSFLFSFFPCVSPGFEHHLADEPRD